MDAHPTPEMAKLAALREALPATAAGIFLNTGSCGPLPAETVRAMREIEDWELRVGRADQAGWEAFLERLDECRGVLAALLSTSPGSIAVTHSTTEGMGIAAWAIDWQAGDRVVTTNAEHAGVLAPLLAVGDRFGVSLDVVDVDGGADADVVVERIAAAMTPRTRLVALSHVLWTTGGLLPVAEIGRLVAARGAWFAVDAAQSAGAVAVEAEAIGADFVAFSGQKWLLGPEGTGGLYASPRAVAEARQSTAGVLGYDGLDPHGRRRADARRFETAGLHRPSVTGLARSVGWLEMYVGLAWAFERGLRLAAAAADRLAAIAGVTLLTPRRRMAGLITFRIDGWAAGEARDELARRAFAITRTIPDLDALRISVAFFNSEEELERFAGAVEELAQHTPASLPRRPDPLGMAAAPGRG